MIINESPPCNAVFAPSDYKACVLAQGGNLTNVILRKAYTNTEALSWALDIARALDFMHSQRPVVLHRVRRVTGLDIDALELL